MVAGRPGIGISPRSFERWDNSSVSNTPAEQARLLDNFRQAMEFQGLAVEV